MTAKAFLLKDKVALVAGDSKIWAKPIVAALAASQADIAVSAQKNARLEEAAEAAKKYDRRVMAIRTDVTDESQVKETVDMVMTEYGHIDILVNTGDIHFFQPFLEIKRSEWRTVMDYNFNSTLYFCRAVGRHMLKQKSGRIINIVSGLGERGLANGSVYCISMGCVYQLTKALALEWAREGITVNAIGTGWFDTPGEKVDDRLARYIPAKRYGQPEEIGSLVVYLSSDTTEFTTGQTMYVDGGLMAHA